MLVFNRYAYQPSTDLIGKGPQSRVYKAVDKEAETPVAVKIYRGNDQSDRIGLADADRFLAFDHPNICRYLYVEDVEREGAFGDMEKMQICVQELATDGDLGAFYKQHPDPERLKELVTGFLRGLEYLHGQGVIHRRVKASNLLVFGAEGKVVDFGLSSGSVASKDAPFSLLVGEVQHMAPEQFNARRYGVDGKIVANIDFWSMGVTLYEVITGEMLFRDNKDDSRELVIKNILDPEPPAKLGRLPKPFDRLVARCVVKEAAVRVQDVEELIAILSGRQEDTAPLERPVVVSDDTQVLKRTPVSDDTQVLKRPAASDDTQVLPRVPVSDDTQVLPRTPASDDTQVLPRIPVSDDTQVLPRTPVSDDTQVLKRPAASDDTQVLPRTPISDDTQVLPRTPTSDDTQVLPKAPVSDDTQVLQQTPPPLPPPPPPPPPMHPEESHSLFNRYEYNPKTGLIGRGGFSRVYKAFDKKLNRWVALKIYKTGEFSDRYSAVAEIRRVINLDHPNICRYLDIEEIEKENGFGEKELTQICVMELLDGGTLLDYYTEHRTEEVLRKLVNDVLNGLAYLHRNGIIHRDIKPANILIRENYDGPVAKITDFGISKVTDSVNNQSSSALVVSIPYMAPEQLNVKKYGIQEKISYNLDLWALGVTIYELVTGKILFKNSEQDSSEQIMTNIMAPGVPDKIAELPQPFYDIVYRCLVKDARDRVQKADELIVLLNRKESSATPVRPTGEVKAAGAAPGQGGTSASGQGNQAAGGQGGAGVAGQSGWAARRAEAARQANEAAAKQAAETAAKQAAAAAAQQAAMAAGQQGGGQQAAGATGQQAAGKKGFSVIADEQTSTQTDTGNKKRSAGILGIAIAAAAVVLAIGGYIYFHNKKMKDAVTIPAQQADSVSIIDQAGSGQKPKDTTTTGGSGVDASGAAAGAAAGAATTTTPATGATTPSTAAGTSGAGTANDAGAANGAGETGHPAHATGHNGSGSTAGTGAGHPNGSGTSNPNGTAATGDNPSTANTGSAGAGNGSTATGSGSGATGSTGSGASKPAEDDPGYTAVPNKGTAAGSATGATGAATGTTPPTGPGHKLPGKGAAGLASKYVLMLKTSQNCSVTINNIPYGTLKPGGTMKLYLQAGAYVISATSTSHKSQTYTGRLEVKPEMLDQVGEFKISL